MRTTFDELEVWSGKKTISMSNAPQKGTVIRIAKEGIIINPEKFIYAEMATFDPDPEEHKESTECVKNYLKENKLEMFSIMMITGIIRNLVKPKNVTLYDFLYK